jgi:hypothetical protein
VYGDAAYGAGELLEKMEAARIDPNVKVQPPTAAGGKFAKDRFDVDLERDTVSCPNGVTAPIGWGRKGGVGRFGDSCASCPLARRLHRLACRAQHRGEPPRSRPGQGPGRAKPPARAAD